MYCGGCHTCANPDREVSECVESAQSVHTRVGVYDWIL